MKRAIDVTIDNDGLQGLVMVDQIVCIVNHSENKDLTVIKLIGGQHIITSDSIKTLEARINE